MLETNDSNFRLFKAAAAIRGGRRFLLLLTTLTGFAVLPPVSATEPLAIEWSSVLGNTNTFNLRFNRPVNPHTATNLANYQLSQGVAIFAIIPQYGTNLQEYVLTTTPPPGNTGLTVNGVSDFSMPPEVLINAQSTILFSEGWTHAYYYGRVNGGPALFGDTLAHLHAATNRFTPVVGPFLHRPYFPGLPDKVAVARDFESGPGVGTDYGVMLCGYVAPPESGNYVFHISAGGQAALYLGDNSADPASRRLIAVEPVGAGFRGYLGTVNRTSTEFGNASFPGIGPGEPVNRSDRAVGMIRLEKEGRYWIEVLAKFGSGSDHVSVAWQTPSGPAVADGDAPIGRQHLISYGSGVSGPVSIVQTNIPTTATEGESISMSTIHGGSQPFDYQWFRDGRPILDATNRVYTIERVTLDMDGANFACRIRNYFSETSTDPLQTAGRPTLAFHNEGGHYHVVWPAAYWDFTLQSSLNPALPETWGSQAEGVLSATELRFAVPTDDERRFFRAMKQFPASPPQMQLFDK